MSILMFGTAPPSLKPLNGIWKDFADRNRRFLDAARVRADIEHLPAPRNRVRFAEAMRQADDMILKSFSAAGWAASRTPFRRRRSGLQGANLLACKPGTESDDLVLVGAHFDTMDVSPGADDNTASVAALLELARLLQPYSFRNTIMLAAFDMEEMNELGSKEFVSQLASAREVCGAIIYETMAYSSSEPHSQMLPRAAPWLYPRQVARLRQREFRGDWTAVLYRQSAVNIAKSFGVALDYAAGPHSTVLLRDLLDIALIGPLFQRLNLSLEMQRSDHMPFWQAGIPAILVTDTADFRNPNYHQPTDTPDTLDYARLTAIIEATAVTIAELAGWHAT